MAKDWTGNYNSVFKTLGSSHLRTPAHGGIKEKD